MNQKNNFLLISLLLLTFSKNLTAQNCGTPDFLLFGTLHTSSSSTPYWDSIPGATSYNVEYRIRNIGAAYSAPISTNTNSLLLTNLTPSTNYEFIVQSVCEFGTSQFSPSGWFTTLANGSSTSITRGPYMTVATSSSVTIQWKTDLDCNTEVTFGTIAGNLNKQVSNSAITTNHSILVTDLLPNTKYYYSVGIIGTSLQETAENYFYTAPSDNNLDTCRFWVTGDFGNGSSAQFAVRNSFSNYTSGKKVNGWLWLGDNAYANGTDQEYQNNVFDVYPAQFKNIPVFPAPGNHDYAQSGYQSTASLGTNFPYFNIFSIPTNSGTEKYYSTNYGNIHFIALDSYGSYNSSSSAMFRWLENDLSNNNQQWTVVYFHHPPYTKGSHDSDNESELIDIRNNIIPLLESNGVDLVLSGHSHSYERSKFIKGHFGTENTFNSSHIIQSGSDSYSKTSRTGNGTIYAVCGVSGKVSSTTSGFPHNAMQYSNANNYGSMILDFKGNSLTGQFLTSTGSILDSFTITKPPLNIPSAVSEITNNNSLNFDVFPNPANKEFNILFNGLKDKNYKLNIYNTSGQMVFENTIELEKNNTEIVISKNEIKQCVPGIYLISISDENESATRSIIIE